MMCAYSSIFLAPRGQLAPAPQLRRYAPWRIAVHFANVDGQKRSAFPKGIGECPACSEKAVAKCGTQKLWHWAHATKKNCDPWWENETVWHREWKSHWAPDQQEVVQYSEITGEKHIADVKNLNGTVLEFQHSQMNETELRSRESFYGDMVWVVNGGPFLKNIAFGAKLPKPEESLSKDMCIYPPQRVSGEFVYYLASKREPGSTMVEIHGSHRIEKFVQESHIGHYLFMWKYPREIWLISEVPVYFDFGGEVLWRLSRFNSASPHCLQPVAKSSFIGSYGGRGEA